MKTRIQKWGNSLALRIPKTFAEEANLKENSPVEVSVTEGKLVVSPASKSKLTLDKLLAGVTAENIHAEVDTGPAKGNEVW
jgi:antitoxin MazE